MLMLAILALRHPLFLVFSMFSVRVSVGATERGLPLGIFTGGIVVAANSLVATCDAT
jgi:hypothetical protein